VSRAARSHLAKRSGTRNARGGSEGGVPSERVRSGRNAVKADPGPPREDPSEEGTPPSLPPPKGKVSGAQPVAKRLQLS